MIRLGTRGSDLALRQAALVTERLRSAGHEVKVEILKTRGDATDRPFREIEGKAFFTKELDDALLSKQVDLAVHSLKDLPTEDPAGLSTLCVLRRADPRDLLLLRGQITVLRDAGGLALPQGIRIGTSSARRFAQLEHAFPGVKVLDLRGNVPTRIAKLRRGDYEGIVIAAAGVERLGLELKDLTVLPLEPPLFLPAPGQGVLAARLREEDRELEELLSSLVDPDASACARAERLLLEKLEGGCSLPLGVLAQRAGEKIVLEACLWRDGRMRRARVETCDPLEAAAAAVRELLGEAPESAPPAEPDPDDEAPAPMVPTVIVTRPDGHDHELARVLREQGFAVVSQPAIRFEDAVVDDHMRAALRGLDRFDVVVFTSRHAVRAFVKAAKRLLVSLERVKMVAALGGATAQELARHGLSAKLVSDGSGSLALAEMLVNRLPPGTQILHPGPAAPEPAFADRLARARIRVTKLPLYETRPVADDPDLPPGLLLAILVSASAARSFLSRAHARELLDEQPCRLHLVAGGATTAGEIQRLGRTFTAQARSPAITDLVPAVADALEKLAREIPC